MTFKEFSKRIAKIEDISSRNDMTIELAELFDAADQNEIKQIMYMLMGQIGPQYDKKDFGLGEKMIVRAAKKALDVSEEEFDDVYKESGDVGTAVQHFKLKESSKKNPQSKSLSISDVYNRLEAIADASGEGSQDEKITKLAHLMQDLDSLSSRYIARIPAQTLRLGFSDMTILDALSWMLQGDKKARKPLENAYHVHPDLGFIAYAVKKDGLKGIEDVEPEVFTPILMMKAQRLPTPKDIFEKLESGIIEPKYDGFRLQAHYKDGKNPKVELYSRNLEKVTHMYPDIVEGIKRELNVTSAIIEGEAIGYDENTESFMPFQQTVQRRRKYDIQEKALEIPLKMFAFEMLYCEGESYLSKPLEDRVKALRASIKQTGDITKDTLLVSPEDEMNSTEDVETSFDRAIEKGLEGIMIKKKTGAYKPGARGWNWIKYKRSYSSKIDDTIDCLVLGYDAGKGKRAEFGIGAFLVGVYDEENDEFVTVAKIGTGLSDDDWRKMYKRGEQMKADKKPALYNVGTDIDVDVWMKPEYVVEIKADELTKSPTHTAQLALRFPRLERFRDDKRPEDATTLKEIQQMFKSQKTS